jgi:hypothetical protein
MADVLSEKAPALIAWPVLASQATVERPHPGRCSPNDGGLRHGTDTELPCL